MLVPDLDLDARYEEWLEEADNDVLVNEDDVAGDFATLAHKLMVWGTRLSEAQAIVTNAKRARDRTAAELQIDVRERYFDLNKKGTEALFSAEVEKDPSYQEVLQDYMLAEYLYSRVRSVTDALRVKKDALVTIGATQRAEMGA